MIDNDQRKYKALHLIRSWLQITSASALEKSVYQTKVYKLCCSEILSQIGLNGQRLNPLTHQKIQVTGGEVSSNLPEFHGHWMLKATHITLYIKLCNSSNIRAPTELSVSVCFSVLLVYCLVPYLRDTCFRIT